MYRFSEILKDLICEKDLSLRKLSLESNVSATQYGKYLKGSYPTVEVAVKIANYFKCSLDYIFGLTETNNYNGNIKYDLDKFVPRYVKLLKSNNITHYKFAKNNNLSESCLRHWKYGDIPKIETLIIIAMNLSCSIEYLIGRSDKQ